jgi:hypothetical protein
MPTKIQKIKGLLTLRRHHIPQPSLSLYALPAEVIEHIAKELELADLCHLRLVCKILSHKTVHYFGLTYFAYARTNLSFTSLQKLQELSQHEHLGQHVRTLLIQGPHGIGRGFSWHRNPSRSLILPHPGVRTLRESLLALENCRSFCLYNDGQGKYGQRYERDCLRPSDAVAILLNIIAETGLSVRSFAADFFTFCDQSVDLTLLHLESYRKPEFRSAWSQLQELSLRQYVDGHNINWVRGLILGAPNLRCLTLCFGSEHINYFFDQVKSCDRFPRLQELNISNVNWHNESFFDFVFHFRDSLRVLRLASFSLDDGRSWKAVFPLLKTKLPVLETISVYFICEWIPIERYGTWGRVRRRITFPGFFGRQNASGLETIKQCLLDGWNEVADSEFSRCSVFRTVPEGPGVSGLGYSKFIITSGVWGSIQKEVHGVSYSGANIREVLDMLAELAFYK